MTQLRSMGLIFLWDRTKLAEPLIGFGISCIALPTLISHCVNDSVQCLSEEKGISDVSTKDRISSSSFIAFVYLSFSFHSRLSFGL